MKKKHGKPKDAKLERKLHLFLDAWKLHVKDEIRLHARLLTGRESLGRHIKDTIHLHRKFLGKIEKLA